MYINMIAIVGKPSLPTQFSLFETQCILKWPKGGQCLGGEVSKLSI